MQRRIRDLLLAADLPDTEAKLYLCLLKLQEATMTRLAAEMERPYISVYRAVRHLQERGLIQSRRINGKQEIFSPLSLAALVRIIDGEQRKLRKLELALQKLDPLLPFLNPFHEDDDAILLREGAEAMREEYLKLPDIFRDEYLHMGSAGAFWRATGMSYESPEERGFIHRRLSRNLYARVLDVPSTEAEVIQQNDSREKRTLLIRSNLPLQRDFLVIAEDRACHFICDAENPRVVVMTEPALVSMQRHHFDTLWNTANGR